jgi:hypothetical protein
MGNNRLQNKKADMEDNIDKKYLTGINKEGLNTLAAPTKQALDILS